MVTRLLYGNDLTAGEEAEIADENELQDYAPIYGSMYGDNISQTVTIAATDTHYEVGGGLSGGETSGVTFQNNKELKVLTAGKYVITYSISVEINAANQEIESSVMINSTATTTATAHNTLNTANSPRCLAGSTILNLAVDDVVKFCLSNHTAATNITVSHACMSIYRLGA